MAFQQSVVPLIVIKKIPYLPLSKPWLPGRFHKVLMNDYPGCSWKNIVSLTVDKKPGHAAEGNVVMDHQTCRAD